jgi:hypothetical protein
LYAVQAGLPARFIDLPAGVTLAAGLTLAAGEDEAAEDGRPGDPDPDPDPCPGPGPDPGPDPGPGRADGADEPDEAGLGGPEDELAEADEGFVIAADPLGWLSRAAGHDDPERWWEDVVEHRLGGDPLELFAAIGEAMTELRAAATEDGWRPSPRDLQREAAMRGGIRAAVKAGHERIAVVCGAWHMPALTAFPSARADAEVLRGLPSVKTRATWVPWTAQRLTQASGYGAGVAAPGWYAHLWRVPDRIAERWVVKAAVLLRDADLPASTAAALEAVRLAEALAAVRGRSLPGLSELTDATRSILCEGNDVPLGLITSKLLVGEELGEVPADVPVVPLQADFEAQCRRLKFRPAAADKDAELDLRNETDRSRSLLLHRLRLLQVPWGTVVTARGEGTFKEGWRLRWRPEYLVALIERARYGTTVQAAASAVVIERAAGTEQLPEITRLVEAVVLAELPDALLAVTRALEERSARTGDVRQLMLALPPLARILRYGSVRLTDASLVRGVVDSLLIRVCAGLPAACASLDDDAAADLLAAIEAAQESIRLVGDDAQLTSWQTALRTVADLTGAPGLIAGRCVRLLLDAGALPADETARRLARVLSARDAVLVAVQWLDGFLRGSGLLLVRDQSLWQLLDDWLCGLTASSFDEVLPLLRRSFAQFPWPERRQMAQLVLTGPASRGPAVPVDDWDPIRIRRILPVLAAALGADSPGGALVGDLGDLGDLGDGGDGGD